MKKNSQQNNIAFEPTTPYQKTFKPFNGFEEMNEAEAKEMSNISPIQHLQNATRLIQDVYADELNQPMNKQIKF